MFVITIPGHARGKQRPGIVSRGGFARAYTKPETVNAEAWVRQCCVDQVGSPCIETALSVRVEITVGIPASWSTKKQSAAVAGDVRPTGKPDIDNTTKLFCDALNGVLWRDDAQIVELAVRKIYGRTPSTKLMVTPLSHSSDARPGRAEVHHQPGAGAQP